MNASLMGFPPGVLARPLNVSDAEAVYTLMVAQQRVDLGRVDIELADIVADWQRPSFDLASSTLGVFEAGRLIGYAELTDENRADAAVHPDELGRGIGTALASWLSAQARDRGAEQLRMPVPQGSPGDLLLAALGWTEAYASWVLELPAGAEVTSPAPPPGFVVRAAKPAEYEQTHRVLDDAFAEWRDRESYQDFLAAVVRRPGFEPWQLRVIVNDRSAVVAAIVLIIAELEGTGTETFVDRIATRADHRGRGLAQVLLADGFALGTAHGATSFALVTDTRTGALGLYQKVGMRVRQTWVNRVLTLATT